MQQPNDGAQPHYSMCSGRCNQGREPCPHPLACQVPLDDEPDFYRGERLALGCVTVGLAVIALVSICAAAWHSLRAWA